MPIELWWWVEPLYLTGFLAMFVLIPIAVLIDKVKPYNIFSAFLAVIAIAPPAASGLSLVVWLIINALVFIWR